MDERKGREVVNREEGKVGRGWSGAEPNGG
jgi:hypothetical protein